MMGLIIIFMRIFVLFIILSFSSVINAKDLYYLVEENDQIGIILLSLGHPNLWAKNGKVNQFKRLHKIKYPQKMLEGMVLKISEDNIIFKKNIIISKDNFKFVKKINTNSQYYELLNQEGVNPKQIVLAVFPKIEVVNEIKKSEIKEKREETEKQNAKSSHSINLYPGVGGFMASNKENDRGVQTSTFSGTQPMLQLKGIYSTDLFGSLSVDLLTKKIFNKEFSFPVNIDYRLQFVPKWNITDSFKLALSHSSLRHSYVGKRSDQEIAYELKSNFIGIGFVIPRDNFWFEMYAEKAYSGEITSREQTLKAHKGLRFDAELVYPLFRELKIIPGLNYYQLKDSSLNYNLKVFETRLVMALEFEP